MNYKKWFTFLVLIFFLKVNSQTFSIPKAKSEIVADGDLSEWNNFLGPFVIHNSGEKAAQQTFVALSWTDENLYMAYKCIDSKIVGKAQNKDAQIFYTDDLVEIFIDPDGDGQNYVEIGVNAFSTNYDLLLKCISAACGGWKTDLNLDINGLKTISKITEEGYNVEIQIPFSSLEKIRKAGFVKPKSGTKWKANAFRIDFGNTTEYLALQAYKSSKFGFHQPEEFAVFEFVE